MASKDKNDYFRMFADMAAIAAQAAGKLKTVLNNFDISTLARQMDELHVIESSGDKQKHQLLQKLAKEFITPIEREDILALSSEIDDVTDSVEDVLLKIFMYNIQSIHPEALEFVEVVERCCQGLLTILQEFTDFRKSKTIQASIIELNRLEELGDRLYINAMRSLFTKKGDPLEVMAWAEVYSSLESCCDTCEHVADVVEGVIMKNS
jgi:uncharacterized protein Yka (UPF0111/DUF47 family)